MKPTSRHDKSYNKILMPIEFARKLATVCLAITLAYDFVEHGLPHVTGYIVLADQPPSMHYGALYMHTCVNTLPIILLMISVVHLTELCKTECQLFAGEQINENMLYMRLIVIACLRHS